MHKESYEISFHRCLTYSCCKGQWCHHDVCHSRFAVHEMWFPSAISTSSGGSNFVVPSRATTRNAELTSLHFHHHSRQSQRWTNHGVSLYIAIHVYCYINDLLEIEIRRPKMDWWRNSLHCVWLISDLAVLFRMKVRLLTWITYLNHSKGKHDNIQVEVVFPTPGVPNAQTRCVSVASITFHQKSSVMLRRTTCDAPMPSIEATSNKHFIPPLFGMPSYGFMIESINNRPILISSEYSVQYSREHPIIERLLVS